MNRHELAMKELLLLPLVILLLAVLSFGQAKPSELPVLDGPYCGQKPPGATGALFAPGFISTGLDEAIMAMAPDGTECFWSVVFSGTETIATSRLENGRWTDPEVAPFSGRYFDGWPAFRPDGRRLFFHSARPVPEPGPGQPARVNVWYVDRTAAGWSEPRPVGPTVNGPEQACCPSATRDGTLYVSKKFGDGTEKICRSAFIDGRYQELEVLPETVNTAKDNFHAYVSPDETYLIIPRYGRKDIIGGPNNYYVSFRNRDGGWSELVNPGPGINSTRCGGMATISADGKYIFYQAWTRPERAWARDRKYSFEELVRKETLYPTGNTYDIYWIEAGIVPAAKPKAK